MYAPFEHLTMNGANHLQESILEKLHDHSFIIIIFNLLFDSHWVCLKSCARPSVDVWLLTCLVFFFVHLVSHVFSTTLRTRLGLSHLLVLGVLHCICSYLMGIHLLCYTLGGEKIALHDVVWDVFVAICERCGISRFVKLNPMSFHPLPCNFCVVKLTLYY